MRRTIRTFFLLTTWANCVLVAGAFGSATAEPIDRYLDAGVPTADRTWSGADYDRALKVFTEGKVPLPKLTDAEGRALFLRLVSTENLQLSSTKSVPIQQRMAAYAGVQHGANEIFKLYANLVVGGHGKDVHTEVAYLFAFMLRTTGVCVELISEFLPTLPRDEKYATRMHGLKLVYEGATDLYARAELSLDDTQLLTPPDMSVLLEGMDAALPAAKKAFSAEYRIELRKRLELRQKTFKVEADAARITHMIAELTP